MSVLSVVTVGVVSEPALRSVEAAATVLGLRAVRGRALAVPEDAYDSTRRQYSSSDLLRGVVDAHPPGAARTLGVTVVDLFIPMLTFVFGQAQLGGPAAIVSTARLVQEFYGLPPDPGHLLERVAKEAVHELGHTFGLLHCLDGACAMSLSSNIQQIDRKRAALCGGCAALLRERPTGSADQGPARTERAV